MKSIKINKVDRNIITYEHETRAWERPENRFLRIVLDKEESIAIAAHKSESHWACVERIPDEIADLTKEDIHQASVKLNERPGIPHYKNPEEGYPVDPARSKWAVYRDRPGKIFRALIHFESMPYNKSDLNATADIINKKLAKNAVVQALRPYEETLKKAGIIATPPDKRKPAENRQVLFDRQPESLTKQEKWIEVAKQCVDEAEKQIHVSMFDRNSMLMEPPRLKSTIEKIKSHGNPISKHAREEIIRDLADTLARQARRSSST